MMLFIYLLFACPSERRNKKYPREPFSFGKHLDFSSPYNWKGLKSTTSSSCKTWHSKLLSYVPSLLGCQHSSGKIVLACYWKVSQWRKHKIKVQIQQHAQYHPYSAKFLNGYWTLLKCLKILLNRSLYTLWVMQS